MSLIFETYWPLIVLAIIPFVSVLISWGRFSEVFGYNDDSKELYLDVGQETA